MSSVITVIVEAVVAYSQKRLMRQLERAKVSRGVLKSSEHLPKHVKKQKLQTRKTIPEKSETLLYAATEIGRTRRPVCTPTQ